MLALVLAGLFPLLHGTTKRGLRGKTTTETTDPILHTTQNSKSTYSTIAEIGGTNTVLTALRKMASVAPQALATFMALRHEG